MNIIDRLALIGVQRGVANVKIHESIVARWHKHR